MNIQVLGTGCSRCKTLFEVAQRAIQELDVSASIEKVEDIEQIMAYQIFMTPGLAINGHVKAAGRIPSVDEVKKLILAAKAA